MSADIDSGGSEAELLPLRRLAEQRGASPEDRWLAAGLASLYPEARAEDPGAGWEGLQEQARRLAQRRRRGYLLRELLAALVPRRAPLWAAAAATLALLLLLPGDGLAPAPPGASPLLAPRVSLSGESFQARLLVGAELQGTRGAVEVDQQDQQQTRITLRSGVVRLQVPPLGRRGRLMVVTADAEVVVHGTQFSVRKGDADHTTVTVEEGLVEVRPQGTGRAPTFLRPGEALTVSSPARYREEVRARAAQLISASRCDDPEGRVDTFLALSPSGEDRSAAQYLKGFCAAQRGESDEAIRWFERAAEESRDGMRADNALARAAMLRARRDERGGAAAWRRYLERFPGGLHRESARLFLNGRP